MPPPTFISCAPSLELNLQDGSNKGSQHVFVEIYVKVCPLVQGYNPLTLASGLSAVQVDKLRYNNYRNPPF